MRGMVWTGLAAIGALGPAETPPTPAHDRHISEVLARWDHDEHHDLRGVVVWRGGRPVAERYYDAARPDELHDIRSAGKSVTALLVGIAVDRGAIRLMDDRVDRYWRDAAGSAIGAVPLRDVLAMRSGLAASDEDPASPGNEDRMDASPDPRAFVLALPLADPPGSQYRYNSVTAYVAGIVVAEATRTKMADFAGQRLFAPVGITHWRWDTDAAGVTKGQGNLWLTTRALAAMGEMVRNGGRVARPAGGQREMDRRDAGAKGPHRRRRPLCRWLWLFLVPEGLSPRDVHVTVSFASGKGGNKIYVVPACQLVVAVTSSAYGHGYGQRRSEAILRAILSSALAGGGCRTSGDALR